MKKDGLVSLIDDSDARVTHAAVLLRPDREPLYLVAKGKEGQLPPAGFEFYNEEEHHTGGGAVLCCGNCYEMEGKEVPIHHRDATAPRIAGGDQRGNRATFAANPNTVGNHTEYCQDRRLTGSRAAFPATDVKIHINLPATYSGLKPPHSAYARTFDEAVAPVRVLEPRDERLKGCQPIAVSKDMHEYLVAAARLSRAQAQKARYVIDGAVGMHEEIFIDNDGWKTLHRTMSKTTKEPQAPRIFHVHNPKSVPLTDFASVAAGEAEPRIKVSLRQYEFIQDGTRHIMQPSIETANPQVKAMLESTGDFFVAARFVHEAVHTRRSKQGPYTLVHQIRLLVDDPSQLVQLYRDGRKVRDLNTIRRLEQDSAFVQPVQPRAFQRPVLRDKTLPGQHDMFATAEPAPISPQ